MERQLVRTEPDTQVLVQTQRPENARAEVVFVHGLEGGGDAGYIVSLAYACLKRGFVTHRFHMRTCGGTERMTNTLYHGGLTGDLRVFIEQRSGPRLPLFLVGFSLGGNVVLKLAGEMGESAVEKIAGICAVSVPIDLGVCARRLDERDNVLYQRRFVKRMQQRLIATGRYTAEQFRDARSIYAIDDVITAPSFGFGRADRYYATQSAGGFLEGIRVPTIVIQAKDDTFIPFRIFDHPAFRTNPNLRLVATEFGGHLGFLQKGANRFWLDEVVPAWIAERLEKAQAEACVTQTE